MKDWLTITKIFYFVVFGVAIGALIFVDNDIALKIDANVTYSDFITILLTALAVMLAALTAILASLALISWRNFETRVRTHVDEYLDEFVEPSKKFESVEKAIRESRKKAKDFNSREGEIENLSEFDEDVV